VGSQLAIELSLHSAVFFLRRMRQNLDDYLGVEQGIEVPILKARLSADHAHIGIGVHVCALRIHSNAKVRGVHLAVAIPQLIVQTPAQIANDIVVIRAHTRHGEDLAIDVFALALRFALGGKILLGRDEGQRLRGHTATLPRGSVTP